MTHETRIQWHPAFCDAVELTFLNNAASLDYTREFNLSSKPLQVDLLVIEKDSNIQIEDEVGKSFKRYNLLEYKSPGDELSIDTYYKTVGYGCLYKVLARKHVDEIRADDITLTLVRHEKPKELLGELISAGLEATSSYPGIYHVSGNVIFDTQIISTKELPLGTHIWLKALTRNIDKEEAHQVVKYITAFPEGSRERTLADSVLQVALSANYGTFEILKEEDPIMCDALRELMKPEMDEARDENRREIALRMIYAREPDEKITSYTGLTETEVEKLRKQATAMT